MAQGIVYFPCGKLSLEGHWDWPTGDGPFPAAVVCHPHPLLGGDMWNNVVNAVCLALARRSIAAFRFNFRGVGSSQGDYAGGVGEAEDVQSALEFVGNADKVDAQRLGLVGYSFGASVILAALPRIRQVAALALISTPLPTADISSVLLPAPDWHYFAGYPRPKLLVSGDRDTFAPPTELHRLAEKLAPPKEVVVIPKMDHFWLGWERELAATVADFLLRNLGIID